MKEKYNRDSIRRSMMKRMFSSVGYFLIEGLANLPWSWQLRAFRLRLNVSVVFSEAEITTLFYIIWHPPREERDVHRSLCLRLPGIVQYNTLVFIIIVIFTFITFTLRVKMIFVDAPKRSRF